MAFRLTPPQIQFLNQYGAPLTGGQLFFYLTGTSTPAETFFDSALTIPNPNPIILDGSGSCPAPFLAQGQLYKVVLEDVNGVVIYSVDPVSDPTSSGASVTSHLSITDQAGTPRSVFLQTAGLDRFGVALNSVNESGNNAGSNLTITSYNDDGSPGTVVMTVNRASGVADFGAQPTVGGQPLLSAFVGVVAGFPATKAPPGWLACDGTGYFRAAYPALWAFANASGNVVPDATWTAGGVNGAFSSGDGSTTFRVPDFRGYFLRAWAASSGEDAGRGIGTYQADAIQDHAHNYFETNGDNVTAGSGSVLANHALMSPAAQTSSPVAPSSGVAPRIATETRPANIAILYCIKT